MASNTSLSKLQKKLERLELQHLRQLAASLQQQLEESESARLNAEESADFWSRHAMDLQETFHDDNAATHRCIGLAKTGELMVVRMDA